MAYPTDPNTTGDQLPTRPPPGMQALLEEYRRCHPAFRCGPVPDLEPSKKSTRPLLDALLAEYRAKDLL